MNIKKINWFLMSGGGWSPSNISSLQFWMDGNYQSGMTRSGDLNQNVDTIVDRKSAYSITGVPTPRAAYNGSALYFDGTDYYTHASASAHKYLHGGDMTIYVIFKIIDANPNAGPYTIIGNNDFSSANIGFTIQYDDRAASSRSDALLIHVSNGSGTPLFYSGVLNDVVTPGEYCTLKIRVSGNNITAWVRNESEGAFTQIWTAAKTGAYSSANATKNLFVGATSLGTNFFTGYNKQVLFFNTALSAAEQTQMDAWCVAEMANVAAADPMNIYFIAGQSNANGRASNTGIASDLNSGPVGAWIWNASSTAPSAAQNWGELELGVNNTSENLGTNHGMQMRLGKGLNALNPTGIIQYAIGGTALKQVASTDWNTASVGEYYSLFKTNVLFFALRELVHKFGKTPVFRGFIWMQGEADTTAATAGGSVYQVNLENLAKGIIDYLITLGWDTTKLRVSVMRIRDQWATSDPTNLAQVRAAQDAYDLSAYIPAKAKSQRTVNTDTYDLQADNLHYNTTGIEEMGTELVSYYGQYVNE